MIQQYIITKLSKTSVIKIYYLSRYVLLYNDIFENNFLILSNFISSLPQPHTQFFNHRHYNQNTVNTEIYLTLQLTR